MAPAIPDRWIPYKACGNVIEGTRFICFKVPLRIAVQQRNPDIEEIWDIQTLLKTIPNLGAVIDLTNTARYYSPKELNDAGVLHKKIFIPGRIIPPQDIVSEFMNAVDEFLGKGCDSLIGIHCTHGLNRTGYMVCRYMRDRLGVNPKEAIEKFEKARGYKIERDNYIADLLGHTPPPPFIGVHTKIRPVGSSDFSNDIDVYNEYSDSKWRDKSIDHSPGKYVRHPDFQRKRKRKYEEASGSNDSNENGKTSENITEQSQENEKKKQTKIQHNNSFRKDSENAREASSKINNNYGDHKRPRYEYYNNQEFYRSEHRNHNTRENEIRQVEQAEWHGNGNYGNHYSEYESYNKGGNRWYEHDNRSVVNNTYERYGEQGGYNSRPGRGRERGSGSDRGGYSNNRYNSTQNHYRPYDHRHDY